MSTFLRPQARTHLPNLYLAGGQRPSGAGRSDGDALRASGSGSPALRPRFDAEVQQDGYRWWYVDALSDDRRHGLTIIGFVGSVFSPYYKRARARGRGNPMNHCCINVALYGATRRWAMTERAERFVTRSADTFQVGPSSMTWDQSGLTISIHEICSPVPLPLRGEVRLTPHHLYDAPVALDAAGRHHWRAVATDARIAVTLDAPRLSWSGTPITT